MSKCNWFHKMLVNIFHIPGTEPQVIADTNKLIRDIKTETNRLLREKELQIIHLKQELEKFTSRTMVWIDPTVRARGYEQSAWNSVPDKNTDKPHVPQGMRERAMLHQLQERPGTFARVHAEMQRKKAQTVNHDPDTVMLPAATAPEDDWTNGGIDKTARHQATKP